LNKCSCQHVGFENYYTNNTKKATNDIKKTIIGVAITLYIMVHKSSFHTLFSGLQI